MTPIRGLVGLMLFSRQCAAIRRQVGGILPDVLPPTWGASLAAPLAQSMHDPAARVQKSMLDDGVAMYLASVDWDNSGGVRGARAEPPSPVVPYDELWRLSAHPYLTFDTFIELSGLRPATQWMSAGDVFSTENGFREDDTSFPPDGIGRTQEIIEEGGLRRLREVVTRCRNSECTELVRDDGAEGGAGVSQVVAAAPRAAGSDDGIAPGGGGFVCGEAPVAF